MGMAAAGELEGSRRLLGGSGLFDQGERALDCVLRHRLVGQETLEALLDGIAFGHDSTSFRRFFARATHEYTVLTGACIRDETSTAEYPSQAVR